jgi:tRNA(Ile)-lysidine synthase
MRRALDALDRRLDSAARTPVAVAFSGGSDSLSLLLLAKCWADRCGRPLLALTVDHGLQPGSGAWTQTARQTAERLGVDFRALAWRGEKPVSGIPAAARTARHRLLGEAARQAGAGVILFGHTLDDQLENALMRGAGHRLGVMRDWSPSPVWPEGRGLFHCRPLLTERRGDLMAWLAGQGLTWIEDPANKDLNSPRARARLQLRAGEAPSLASGGPGEDAMARLARRCTAFEWGGLALPRRLLAGHGQAMRLLQAAAACVAGRQALGRPDRAHALLGRIEAGETFVATLGGARIEAGRDLLVTREAGEFDRTGPAVLALPVGQAVMWDGRFELTARHEGLSVSPLRGHAARLKPEQREALGRMPAGGRGALPAVLGSGSGPYCPIFSERESGEPSVGLYGWVRPRFEAVCGLLQKEGESSPALLMANLRKPSYVSVEAKGF